MRVTSPGWQATRCRALLDLHDSLTKSAAATASKPKVAAAKAPARTKKAKQKAAAGARA
jgi:hypothetical protein